MESPFRLGWQLPRWARLDCFCWGFVKQVCVCFTLFAAVLGSLKVDLRALMRRKWLGFGVRLIGVAMLGLHGVVRGATRDMANDWRGWAGV